MSGISPGHNKFVSCDNCPDRTIEPNCHTPCKGYKFRQKKERTSKTKTTGRIEYRRLHNKANDKKEIER